MLVHSFWFLVVYVQRPAASLINYLCVRCGYHTTAPRESKGLISHALQKLLIINHYHKKHESR